MNVAHTEFDVGESSASRPIQPVCQTSQLTAVPCSKSDLGARSQLSTGPVS